VSFSLLYSAGETVLRAYAKVMLRMNILVHDPPPPGPRIIVANHPTAIDPFLIHVLIPGRVSGLITKSAFDVPIFGAFLRKAGQIRLTGLGDKAIAEAFEVLEKGGTVALFPEGTYSPREGGFLPPRTGAARLALMSGAPVVPIGIHVRRERSLTLHARVKGKHVQGDWYFSGPCHVTIGKAMRFSGDPGDRRRLFAAAEEMMAGVRALAAESGEREGRSQPGPTAA